MLNRGYMRVGPCSDLSAVLREWRWICQARIRAVFGFSDSAESWNRLEETLQDTSVPPVPQGLQTRIRCKISRERARKHERWAWLLEDFCKPVAFPAVAGLLLAVLVFVTLVPLWQAPVRAASDDVPLELRTRARLRTPAPMEFQGVKDSVMLQLLIDRNGHVADFDVLAGRYTPEELRNIRNSLLFTEFDPATVFGRPTQDTLLLSLESVRVGG